MNGAGHETESKSRQTLGRITASEGTCVLCGH
jgi:hypothetical protein